METTEPVRQNFIKKIFTGKNSKRNIFIFLLCVGSVGIIYYKFFTGSPTTAYEYATATRKDLQKKVEGSGTVVSVSELDIQQLQNGGKVTSVRVKPGDYVKQGQIIATLDNRSAAIQVQQAKASYEKLINGATSQTTDITKQSVITAQANYDQAVQTQNLSIASAKRNLLNSNIAAISVYDTSIQPNSPIISGTYTCDSETVYDININRPGYADISSVGGVSISSVPQPIGNCGLYISFDSTKNFNGGEWKISIPNKLATNYNSNLNAYNSSLLSRDQALLSASSSLATAKLNLNQQIAPARSEDILAAQATLDSANLNYDNTIIRAPFDGQIGSVSAAVGQQTNSQAGVATIITKDKIAQVNLNEIDIVNVKLGEDVELKFDAIADETFVGKVSEIDNVGLTASNVVTFPIKISIPNADQRIKSGMSVTANIIVDKKENVLSVPSSTIKNNFVNKKVGLKNEKVSVVAGITNDIDTEIVQGLNEGDMVVSKIKSSASTTKTTSSFNLFGGGGNRGQGR